jgi:hypothetical protein
MNFLWTIIFVSLASQSGLVSPALAQSLSCEQIYTPNANDDSILLRQLAANAEANQRATWTLRELGHFFYIRQRWAEAQVTYQVISQRTDANSTDITRFLHSLKKQELYSDAIQWFETLESRSIFANHVDILSLMALIYMNEGQSLYTAAHRASQPALRNELYRQGHLEFPKYGGQFLKHGLTLSRRRMPWVKIEENIQMSLRLRPLN